MGDSSVKNPSRSDVNPTRVVHVLPNQTQTDSDRMQVRARRVLYDHEHTTGPPLEK